MTKENAHDLARAFGYLTQKEVRALKKLAKMLPLYPCVVNIGAGAGTSGVAFLETREDLYLHTVDIRQDSPLGSLQSELNAIEKAKVSTIVEVGGTKYKRHFQYLGDSKIICSRFAENGTALVFIDGDHSKEGVRGDIDNALTILEDGGIIVFDDYGENKGGIHKWPEVKIAVDELIKPYYEEILHKDSVIAFRIVK